MTKILLADDHMILRRGLKMIVGDFLPHAEIDEAWNGETAYQKIKEKHYQLIILDINMPDTDSFQLVENIIALRPDSNILMFTMNHEDLFAKKYLQLGAKGYLEKTASEDEIKAAINKVLKGRRYLSDFANEKFLEDVIGNKAKNPFDDLSPREFQTMLHLIQGESLSKICDSLNLQTSTVGTYKSRIFEKLQCENVIQINQLAKIYNIAPQY